MDTLLYQIQGHRAALTTRFSDEIYGTSTCRRHGLDPQRYLTQLLTNLPGTKLSDLDHWLPDAWKRRTAPPPTEECG